MRISLKPLFIYLYKFNFKGAYERPEKYVAKNKTRKENYFIKWAF